MRAGLIAVSLAAALGLGVGFGAVAGHADRPVIRGAATADRPTPFVSPTPSASTATPSSAPVTTMAETPVSETATVSKAPTTTPTHSRLDPRCLEGRVICVDKTARRLSWVVDGHVRRQLAVRFGSQYTPTREGQFTVYRKSADHVSNLFGSSMPYAMFFSRGQAVHYSSDFAARGYAGASHGCVNVRDKVSLAALFAEVRVGDTVLVYRS
jgi:lipoprotein-anchoring transpeptidase ErfK/SrfK